MSLSEHIALLANPVPVFEDPEDYNDRDTSAKVVELDTELYADNYVDELGTSLLRARNTTLLEDGDSRYAGKKTSRKNVQKFHNSDSDGEYQGLDGGDGMGDDDSEDNDKDAVLKHFKERMIRKSDRLYEPPDDSDEESDSEEAESEGDISGDQPEETPEDVTGSTIMTFSAATPHHLQEDAEKGRAVKCQLALWDTMLKSRIQLQKAMVAANQLPRSDVWGAFHDKGGQNFVDAVDASRDKVRSLLDCLIDLQTSLLARNPETRIVLEPTKKSDPKTTGTQSDEEITSDTDDEEKESDNQHRVEGIIAKNKRKLAMDEYSVFMQKRHCDFHRYRDATINNWNERTKLTTGKMKSFDKFEQSTLKQIEHIMYDNARLIKRTQMKRSSYLILGKTLEQTRTADAEETEENEAVVAPLINESVDTDVEIFDDNDFYHQILRELIERKTAGVSDSVVLGRQWLQIQKLRSKMKKKVDTKASKGRKIRYDVHAKLMNFMAPVDTTAFSDEAKNELFNSLFGKNNNVN